MKSITEDVGIKTDARGYTISLPIDEFIKFIKDEIKKR